MPTKKPRCTITFDPNVYHTLTRLAELQGITKSAVIGEFFDAIHPPLMRTVALLEAAAEAPRQVRAGIRQTVEDMERLLVASAGEGIRHMDAVLEELQAAASGPSAAEPQRPGEAADPHVVTRGSHIRKGGEKGARRG